MNLHRRLWSAIILVTINFTASVSIGLAVTKEQYITVNSDGSQSFAGLVQEAEDLVKESIAREFQNNPGLTEITVIVTADRGRQLVPVLRSRVSRSQWQKNPQIEQWTRYFADSQYLLGFRDSYTSPTNSGRSQAIDVRAPSRPASRQNDPAFRDD